MEGESRILAGLSASRARARRAFDAINTTINCKNSLAMHLAVVRLIMRCYQSDAQLGLYLLGYEVIIFYAMYITIIYHIYGSDIVIYISY